MNDNRPPLLAVPARPLSSMEMDQVMAALSCATSNGYSYALFPDFVRVYQLIDGQWKAI